MEYCVYWVCGYYGLRFVLGGIETKLCMREPLTAKAVIVGWYVENRQVPFLTFMLLWYGVL
jgi:hypothetical protein